MIGKIMQRIREDGKKLMESLEIHPVRPEPIENTAGVDGGLAVKKHSLFDMIYYRAVGVVFMSGIEFWPSRRPPLQSVPSTSGNSKKHASLLRVHEELSTVFEIHERFNPELIILDGSLFPHPSLKSEKFKSLWKEVKELYDGLKRLRIAGVIKDPKSRELAKTVNSPFRDVSLLIDMPPNSMTEPINRDGVSSFYLRVSDDFPLRIETTINPESVASHILSSNISYVNLPKEIVYADKAVKISKGEVSVLEAKFFNSMLFKRRRDRRL